MDSVTNITINIVEPGSSLPAPDTGLFTHGIGGIETSIIAAVSIITLLVVATFFIIRRKKGLHITKPSKHTSFMLGLLAIATSIGTFAGLALNSAYSNTNAKEGDLTIATKDVDLTIEVGDEPVFAVLPVDVKVQEATPAGYTLTAYTENTDLVSTTDSSSFIPMITTDNEKLVALKDNTYGLSIVKPESKDDKTYTMLSKTSDDSTFITDKDYKATEANDTTTIYYGFYITPDTPYGTYTGSNIYYHAITNSSKVIFDGNGLYFNNNPEQTTNVVEYLTSITDKTTKYAHTPNINDEGEASDTLGYLGKEFNRVVSIPGASKIKIRLSYGGGYVYSGGGVGWPSGFLSFWQGSHPDYTTSDNIDSAIKTCGNSDVTDGKFYGDKNDENIIITTECELEGDAATFAYWVTGNGPGSIGPTYGYYAAVTGYDIDGNVIYLVGNTPVQGEYQAPGLPYGFLGWSEDKDATTATYESQNDIELNLPLTKGKTTELYAIWQYAAKITFHGNYGDSGRTFDKLIMPGESISLCNHYYGRIGYVLDSWNTEPDGSGESYSDCYWYTAPTSQSVELNLYGQWSPGTTIIYNNNGGQGGSSETIRAGGTIHIQDDRAFSKDGYYLVNWNTKPDGSGITYNQGDSFTAPDQSQVITLYAQWTPATTLIYNGNGGEGNQQRQTIRAGNTSSIYGNWDFFIKDGYYFVNWNTKPDGSGITYNQGDSFTAPDQSQVITLYAQWSDCTPNNICYKPNGADGATSMGSQSVSSNTEVTLWPSNFSYAGHGFAGWSEDPDAAAKLIDKNSDNDPVVYGPSQTIAVGDMSKGMGLYAVWIEASANATLQNFVCPNNTDMPIGSIISLIDSRDDEAYAVAKLADGNCWTIENLRLDNSATLDATNTHNPNFASLAPSSNDWCEAWDQSCIDQNKLNTNNTADTVSIMSDTDANIRSYGNYYNWYSANAGNGTYSLSDNTSTTGDICPSGWALPMAYPVDINGTFSYLDVSMGGTGGWQDSTESSNRWRSFPNNFIYSGQQGGYSRGVGGYYWSSTANFNVSALALSITSDQVIADGAGMGKPNGYAVRCVALANSVTQTNTVNYSDNSTHSGGKASQESAQRGHIAYYGENTKDVEDAETTIDDATDTTSTSFQEEPLGEYKEHTVSNTEEKTNIINLILLTVAFAFTILVLLIAILKLRQQEE